jgi:hypothetical protein
MTDVMYVASVLFIFLNKGSDIMIRGTTAQYKFNIPYPISDLLWVTVKFWQPGNPGTDVAPLPITKKLSNEDLSQLEEVIITLSPTETARFSDKLKARLQLRANAVNGTTFASKEQLITVYPMNDDIITDDPEWDEENEEGYIVLDGQSIVREVGE